MHSDRGARERAHRGLQVIKAATKVSGNEVTSPMATRRLFVAAVTWMRTVPRHTLSAARFAQAVTRLEESVLIFPVRSSGVRRVGGLVCVAVPM